VELAQVRLVSEDVESIAGFYAELVGADSTVLNEFYVEVPTPGASVGFSKCRYTEEHGSSSSSCTGHRSARLGEVILDFVVDDVDGEFERIDALGVDWVLRPTTQPWGRRSMLFRDPEGHLVNVFSKEEVKEQ
jgi:uncharacterized glyoxalase superfamily protein PhnB